MAKLTSSLKVTGAALLFLAAGFANASVIKIDDTVFTADADLVTFSEFPNGTRNPTYNPSDYGGGAGSPIVSFGGFFTGQNLGHTGGCPGGVAVDGCVAGTPTGFLSLDPSSSATIITEDGASPTTPVLAGTPLFNGPISILFDTDLAGVGLDGGYLNAIGGTAITAFNRAGEVLGSIVNEMLGIEFLGLATDDNTDRIAGLQFSVVGLHPTGFAIDNLRLGTSSQMVAGNDTLPSPASVPEPGSIALLGLGLLSLGLSRRRTR